MKKIISLKSIKIMKKEEIQTLLCNIIIYLCYKINIYYSL